MDDEGHPLCMAEVRSCCPSTAPHKLCRRAGQLQRPTCRAWGCVKRPRPRPPWTTTAAAVRVRRAESHSAARVHAWSTPSETCRPTSTACRPRGRHHCLPRPPSSSHVVPPSAPPTTPAPARRLRDLPLSPPCRPRRRSMPVFTIARRAVLPLEETAAASNDDGPAS